MARLVYNKYQNKKTTTDKEISAAMLADRLKLARKKTGMSLRDLAETMDNLVTAQAIGKYERGESVPSSGVLLALAKALSVSLTYLLDTQEVSLSGVEFRTKANTTARDRANVETEVLEWIERYLQIEVILGLDSAQWQCPLAKPRKLKNVADAENLARIISSAISNAMRAASSVSTSFHREPETMPARACAAK